MRTLLLILSCIALLNTSPPLYANTDFSQPNTATNSALSSLGGITEEFLPVEQAYILNTEIEPSGQLRLNWQIAEGYYLYRHSFAFTLTSGDKLLATNTTIPEGLKKNDDYFGPVEVYYNNLDVLIHDIPNNASLKLVVTSQGCADAGLCYPPPFGVLPARRQPAPHQQNRCLLTNKQPTFSQHRLSD